MRRLSCGTDRFLAVTRSALALSALALLAVPRPACGQTLAAASAGVGRPAVVVGAGAALGGRALLGDRPRVDATERRRWAPVASLLIPGTGQALLHQDRMVPYLALEAWAVLEYANQRTEALRQRTRYRALARDVARALYGPARPVGTWAYYESMEHYVESGVFTRAAGDIVPESDEQTYNGAMWLLARQTFWLDPSIPPLPSSPEYRNAINRYLERAVRPEYRWSWRDAQLEQDIYVRTIRRTNTAFNGARRALGLVIANHLLSSVDAFATLRVEGLDGGDGQGFALTGRLPLP